MALSDYQSLVDQLVRDDTGKIATGDRDVAIGLARERYSKDRPRAKAEDLTAPGGYNLPLPAAWQADFSSLRSLEYPIGETPPVLLAEFGFYQAPDDSLVIMTEVYFSAGALARANFTIRHQLDAGADTIPVGDREAVASMASAILCDQLAALFSGDSNTTIAADVVDHQGKAELFAARARSLRKIYFDHLGIDPKRSVAAGAVVNFEAAASDRRSRLTHPLRQR